MLTMNPHITNWIPIAVPLLGGFVLMVPELGTADI